MFGDLFGGTFGVVSDPQQQRALSGAEIAAMQMAQANLAQQVQANPSMASTRSQISAEALEAFKRLRGDTSARAAVERSYWERFPASVKYVEQIALTDDSVDLVKRDGVWEMPR